MQTIDRDIVEKFFENFHEIKNNPIVIYGVGERTKLILDEFPDFNIIGLMDRDLVGEKYGLPILTEEEAIERAYCVIIVCALHNLEVIYNRIEKWTRENSIPVFHLNGQQIKKREKNSLYKSINNEKVFKQQIEEHDIISFDLFDTLVTRQVLYPEDIWEIMSKKLGDIEFKENRKKAEIYAKKKYGELYGLRNIYEELVLLCDSYSLFDISYLTELEMQIEYDNILPRKDVVDLLKYACSLNKSILLVSDMYLPKTSIYKILNKSNIDENIFEKIYISNECSMSKSDGSIWKHILSLYSKDKRILHIGDNEESDIVKAKENDINALRVYSGLQIALSVLDGKWLSYENSFDNRYVIGRFISNVFNSPFCICENGAVKINSLKDIGYIFFGPLVKCFMDKLYNYALQKEQIVLFQARDCWILKQIANKYYKEYNVRDIYVLTSRRQIALASINTSEDIDLVCDVFLNSCKYTFAEFCKIIFNIMIDRNDEYFDVLVEEISKIDVKNYLNTRYKEQILREAAHQRHCFNKYLEGLEIKNTDTLAIVNFVGSGGTQMFFERYGFKEYSEYYYFALAPFRVKIEDLSNIISIFGESSNFTGTGNAIAERTMVGECIFTSPDSQFMGFDSNGEFEFAGEGINYSYDLIKECHEGIYGYIEDFSKLDYDYNEVSPEIIKILYSYMFDKSIICIDHSIKSRFVLKDIVKSNESYNSWE